MKRRQTTWNTFKTIRISYCHPRSATFGEHSLDDAAELDVLFRDTAGAVSAAEQVRHELRWPFKERRNRR